MLHSFQIEFHSMTCLSNNLIFISKLACCSYLMNICFFVSYFLYNNYLSLNSRLLTSIFTVIVKGTENKGDLFKSGKTLCLLDFPISFTKVLYSFFYGEVITLFKEILKTSLWNFKKYQLMPYFWINNFLIPERSISKKWPWMGKCLSW